jgi:rhamnopyranosyl-N-acetylglucosaminyl-diphospho-decaprenol beta-1,3/1,4-galactofuranosyltransferase
LIPTLDRAAMRGPENAGMTVAAAVTTFNRLDSLKRCIHAIRAQEHPVDEIVVVNDQSTDGTREWLDGQADLVAIHQPGNFGCACSFHTVLKTVYERGHDFAWAMDDDVFPQPDSLGILLDSAARLKQQGVRLGGLTAYQAHWDQGGTTWLPFRMPSTVARALRYRYLSPDVGIVRGRGEPQEIDHYTFVSTLFTREAMAACGFPNQDFYYYGEDTDYALRLAEQGFKSYVVPRCVVEHAGGGFSAPVLLPVSANWRYYYMYRNQLTLVRMYGDRLGPVKRLACQARIMMGLGKRLLLESRRGNFGACRLALRGATDGLIGRMGKRVAPGTTG